MHGSSKTHALDFIADVDLFYGRRSMEKIKKSIHNLEQYFIIMLRTTSYSHHAKFYLRKRIARKKINIDVVQYKSIHKFCIAKRTIQLQTIVFMIIY